MSIIEKAVNKRSKKADTGVDADASTMADTARDLGSPVQATSVSGPTDPVSSALAGLSPPAGEDSDRAMVDIPLAELEALGMVVPTAPRSQIAEEYRAIKRPVLMNIDGRGAAEVEHANLVMVTSSVQGEGKTFSAINLALSIAMEQDKTVLFVDADVAKASAGQLLGIPGSQAGLIDVLEHKDMHVGDVILHTNIPNLRIVPAGRVHERSTELLASASMRQVMLELSHRYPDRVIIFDSPPLLLTTEASVLASLMGQIVFVVAAEETSHEVVKEGLRHIAEDKIIGMLLNKTRRRAIGKYGYGYGNGYGYGYGYGYGDSRASQ